MTPELHRQLRALLAELYPTTTDARRIADDADVTHHRVAFDSNLTNGWHALLDEAEKQNKVTALLHVAAAEYPHHQALTMLTTRYRRECMPLSNMRLLNFAHPITPEQQGQIEDLLNKRLDLNLSKQIDTKFKHEESYEHQCKALIARVGFTAQEWQSLPLLINPPSFVPGTLCLISQLHGLMRHFPTVLRLRPVTVDGSQTYVVAEILNLQEIRDRARDQG